MRELSSYVRAVSLSTFGKQFPKDFLKLKSMHQLNHTYNLNSVFKELYQTSEIVLTLSWYIIFVHESISFLLHCIYQQIDWYECQSYLSCSFLQAFWMPF